jgi:mannose-6-phosphate isomerase-like protein (cupin superfamily)
VGEAVFIPVGEGEVIGDSADRRVEILSDDETLNATWSRFGPHREGADLHVHRLHTDCFYVLEGKLTVRLGLEDEAVAVPAGTLARVPPLVVHGFRNGSDAELRYLNLHAPGQRFADYLRATRDGRSFSYDQHEPPEDGGRPAREAVVGASEPVAERPGSTSSCSRTSTSSASPRTTASLLRRPTPLTFIAATSNRSTSSRAS